MDGLLDIWDNYWRKNELKEDGTYGSSTDFSKRKPLRRGEDTRSNLSTAGGVPTGNIIPRQHLKRGESINQSNINSVPFQSRMTGKGPQVDENINRAQRAKNLALSNPNVKDVSQSGQVTYKDDAKTPSLAKGNERSDALDLKHHGGDQQDQVKWWKQLAGKMGTNFDKAAASWKDKGGFEGLMANPAFTMGLAFMQAGAEGKSIGQGALDNVMKAGGISQHYKKIIEDRKQAPIQATSQDVAEVKDLLKTLKYDKPNWFEKAAGFLTKGDTGQAAYDQAAEHIAIEVQKEMARMQENYKGKEPLVIDIDFKKKAIENVLNSGKIKKKESWSPWTSGTIKSTSKNPFKSIFKISFYYRI